MDSLTFAPISEADAKSAQQTFKESAKALKKAKEDLAKVSLATFSLGLREVFAKFPEVDSFGWNQYTPYFNDGDTCTFSVNSYSDSIEVNGENPEYDHEDISEPLRKRYKLATEAFSKFLSKFDDETMLEMFGDHVQVVVTPTGAKFSECEHD